MGFSQAPGLPYSKLGIPEDGDTASRAISKGKYVIWKGKNYFAKTDSLQGETFVEDTNLTEIPDGALNGIADELNASIKIEAWVSGTISKTGGAKLANYPSGFNISNCYAKSGYFHYIPNADNVKYTIPNAYASIDLQSDGIYITASGATWTNGNYSVCLEKIT